jgi:hypothetical protein
MKQNVLLPLALLIAVRKSTLAPVSVLGAIQPTHNPAALLWLRTLARNQRQKKSLEQKRQKIESETVMIVVGYLSGTPGYLAN